MNGAKRYGPRAKETALRNKVLGNGRGHANLATGTRSARQKSSVDTE
jgi:hypothetical protein